MFEPLNGLEQALIQAATDPSARPAFISALLDADLYVSPGGPAPADGGLGDIVKSHEAEGWAAAVFTAPQRVAEVVGPDAPVRALKGRALLELLRGGPVRLNPNLVPGVQWSAADLEEILSGVRPVSVPAGTKMLLAHPKTPPAALIAALAARLSALPAVKGAWLLMADRGGVSSWLLGVDHDGPWAPVSAAIGEAAATVDLTDRPLEATPLSQSPLAKTLRGGIPIVAPKKRGFFDFLKG